MKLVVVVQARMRSSRLPGKVLERISGKPLLERMLERIAMAHEPDEIVVATTWDASDQPIVELCEELGVACYEGHPTDCLDRHVQVGKLYGADAVVKIPSDCPLIDPRVIDRVLGAWRDQPQRYDYLSNLHPASWPDGNDVEVIAMRALAAAGDEASDPFEREHTTPFVWSQPDRFRLGNVESDLGEDLSQRFRWVVDWPEDLNVVRRIFAALLPVHGPGFSVDDVLALHAHDRSLERMNLAHHGYSYASQWQRPKRWQLQPIEGALG